MRKFISLAIIMFCMLGAHAQPQVVQKAAQAVFTLTTFKQDGSVLASSHGVFINFDGTAVAPLSAFQGAAKATVVDATGKASDVEVILAFNELYNMVKFRVAGNAPAISHFATSQSSKGEEVWLLPYSIRDAELVKTKISSIEKFSSTYNYYIFQMSA